MDFNAVKALHIIFVVSWFAGLFYIVRLFIYHTEAQEKEEVAKKILSDQYQIMEKKLWWIITTPAMVLTVVFWDLDDSIKSKLLLTRRLVSYQIGFHSSAFDLSF
jgi:uncharacterized integral membrane protein (TIGR00701 family)